MRLSWVRYLLWVPLWSVILISGVSRSALAVEPEVILPNGEPFQLSRLTEYDTETLRKIVSQLYLRIRDLESGAGDGSDQSVPAIAAVSSPSDEGASDTYEDKTKSSLDKLFRVDPISNQGWNAYLDELARYLSNKKEELTQQIRVEKDALASLDERRDVSRAEEIRKKIKSYERFRDKLDDPKGDEDFLKLSIYRDLKIGSIGTPGQVRIEQIINDREFIISADRDDEKDRPDLWIIGIATDRLKQDRRTDFSRILFEITGEKEFTTVRGSKRKVMTAEYIGHIKRS